MHLSPNFMGNSENIKKRWQLRTVRKTQTIRPRNLCLAACMTLLAGSTVSLVSGEEASIMTGSTVQTEQLDSYTPDGDVESMSAEDGNEAYVITDKEHLTETTITVAELLF